MPILSASPPHRTSAKPTATGMGTATLQVLSRLRLPTGNARHPRWLGEATESSRQSTGAPRKHSESEKKTSCHVPVAAAAANERDCCCQQQKLLLPAPKDLHLSFALGRRHPSSQRVLFVYKTRADLRPCLLPLPNRSGRRCAPSPLPQTAMAMPPQALPKLRRQWGMCGWKPRVASPTPVLLFPLPGKARAPVSSHPRPFQSPPFIILQIFLGDCSIPQVSAAQ